MPVIVIDQLEVIEINDEHGKRQLVAVSHLGLAWQAFVKGSTVVQAGQRIAISGTQGHVIAKCITQWVEQGT